MLMSPLSSRLSLRAIAATAAFALAAAVPATAAAHSIWFAQRAGELALVYGHGAEDLSVVRRIGKIGFVGGADAAGRPLTVVLRTTDHLAFVDTANAPAVVAATLDNGLWTQASDDRWLNQGKDEVPGAKQSGRYLKYASHLRELPAGGVQPLAGLAFQIVPVGARFPRHIGEPLPLRVLLDGKPAVGARVWVDVVNDPDGQPVDVDRDGHVTLAVRNQGLNVVKAEIDSPAADARRYDKVRHDATLSFVLPHAPE